MASPPIPFTKMHGLGNDFVMLSADDIAPILEKGMTLGQLALQLCDRHRSIGGDGIIVATPPKTPGCVATFVYWNNDGTIAEMCGNGIRCFARFLHQLKWTDAATFKVDSLAGIKELTLLDNGDVTVDMGQPELAAQRIPSSGWPTDSPVINQPIPVGDDEQPPEVTLVNVGNPHAVNFNSHQHKTTLGPLLEVNNHFPEKINVEFAQVKSNHHITLDVWERGCGWTQACGTGACATVVAAQLSQAIPATDKPVTVTLPGGDLKITWPASKELIHKLRENSPATNGSIVLPTISMTGPATVSFHGSITL